VRPAATAPPAGPAPLRPAASPQPVKLLLLIGVPFLLALLVGSWLAYRYFANRPPQLGSLSVETRPAGASISIDGELRGFSPAEVADLELGAHEVRLSLQGHRTQVRSVEIVAGAAASLSIALEPMESEATTGIVDFSSEPAGAAVSVDGEQRGVTPLEGVELAPGEHAVAMELRGYQPWSGSVQVEAGVGAQVAATLERARRSARATPAPTPEPTPEPTPRPTATPAATPEPTPAGPDPNRIYSAGEVDQDPVKRRENPIPRDAIPRLERGQSVSVTVAYVVDENGRVNDVRIIESGTEQLDAAMIEAIRGWEYEPARLQGQPVKFRFLRKFTYKSG
jgi:TonB family protein